MNRTVSILYFLICIAYPLFCFAMFHSWNSSVLIPSIPLLAIGAWLFGSTSGLFIFFYIECISFALNQYFADTYTYFADRTTGLLIALLVIYLFSRLRMNYEGIQRTTQQLDKRVSERDTELSTLTTQLLSSTEKQRVRRGQELHDSVGQQLTGIQLLCSSLLTHLEREGNKEVPTANTLMTETHRAHNHIRSIARALFPVRIAEVGLIASLIELADCINEIRNATVQVIELADISDMQESTALQLYRICQESINYLITHPNADQLNISLNTSENNYVLGIAHNGSSLAKTVKVSQFGLIQYRLKQIEGTQKESSTVKGLYVIYFEIPKKQTLLLS